MKPASDIVLKLLGVLLFAAAVLKGWQLLTEPVLSTTKSRLWPYVVLTVAMVLIILGIARRRRTAAS